MLLKEAKNEMAFAKIGIQGFAGSGKTFTASKMAIGLSQYIKSDKPVAFLDTETGSSFVITLFETAGVKLVICKSRAFIDLLSVIQEAEKNNSVLIIDSITHFWNELMESYQRKNNITRLTLRDWMPIKKEWKKYTDLYINSKLHIIMCGRAGWDFGYVENEQGNMELGKTDTKMKVEGDTGFEPSLLIEIERTRKEKQKIGSAFNHRAWVLKDRTNTINGRHFDNPTFEDFIPHIKLLNIGGEHIGINTENDSQSIFTPERSNAEFFKQLDIVLEEIEDEITARIPGRAAEDQERKIYLLREIFGTSSWTAVKSLPLEKLKEGKEEIINGFQRFMDTFRSIAIPKEKKNEKK